MFNNAFFKRVIPFFAALALGLMVASFFVSISPNFKFRNNRAGQRNEIQRLRYENDRLRLENERLKIQNLEESERMPLLEAPLPVQQPRVVTLPADSIPAAAPRAK